MSYNYPTPHPPTNRKPSANRYSSQPVSRVKSKKKDPLDTIGWIFTILLWIALAVFFISIIKGFYFPNSKKSSGNKSIVVNGITDPHGFYYSQLSDNEKELYTQIVGSASNGRMSFDTTCKGSTDISKVLYAVTYDHPELYWVHWYGFKVKNTTLAGTDLNIYLTGYKSVWEYSPNVAEQNSELQYAVQSIVSMANEYSTDYEKIKFVHDYLVLNASYAYEELDKNQNDTNGDIYDYIYTAYGCLVKHRCVCAGYSKAFQLIMNNLGIPCTYIVGDTYTGGAHGWNYVELDGKGYYMDVTWDDPDREDYIRYDYFCVSTDKMNETRTPDTEYFSYVYCPDSLGVNAYGEVY